MYTAQNGHVNIVLFLIDKGAYTLSKNKDRTNWFLHIHGWIPFMFASNNGQLEIVKATSLNIESENDYNSIYHILKINLRLLNMQNILNTQMLLIILNI